MTDRRPPLLLLGAGGHAMSCIDVIEQEGRFSIAGLLGVADEVGRDLLGHRVIGADSDLPVLVGRIPFALVALGQIRSPQPRMRLYELARQAGFRMATVVSPRAYVSPHAQVGAGTIVMHGAFVNAGAHVGNNCIINSRAHVEHGATIGSHSHISTAVVLNGDTRVGERCFLGSGSVVMEGVSIDAGSVVAMSSRILRHSADQGATR